MGKTKKEAKKAMGVSPITGIIYYGTLRGDEWVGEKEDVTDMAIRAVITERRGTGNREGSF